MSDSPDISNHSGPGSAAEPSMEEILASIRRILREDDIKAAPAEADEDDDLLVLDASMIAAPADISTATELPVDTGLIAAHDQAPLTTFHEPMHFASEPAFETQGFETLPQTPQTGEELLETAPQLVEPPPPEQWAPEPEPETAPQLQTHSEEELTMEDHVQSPEGLVGDDATSAISNTIGSLVRSISTDRAVSISKGGITIEDIVREEIRPVLKAWFDTHLPSLVERIVRAEIGRVIDRTQA